MADSTTDVDVPQETKPVEPAPEERKEGTTTEGITETAKAVASTVVPDSVLSMFGGGSKPKREEKVEEDDESKGKSKKEEEVSSYFP